MGKGIVSAQKLGSRVEMRLFARMRRDGPALAQAQVGNLYPAFGILLSPMIAAAAMTFTSISVITNALRLQ